MSSSDRRSFFKQLVRAAAEVAQEVSTSIRSFDEPEPIETWAPARPVPAPPTARAATPAELEALCRELGLEKRSADVLGLARVSVRLTRGDEPAALGASRLGGAPDAPAGFEWPSWRDEPLPFLGQVRLADVAALDPETALPQEGLLLLFWDTVREPSGLSPDDGGGCRVVVVEDDPAQLERQTAGPALFHELPLRLSAELTLPRQWHSAVEALDLEPDEFTGWDDVRVRLAALQEVELEELATDWHALHRLLGWPEEIGGEMELDCELVANGIDLSSGSGYGDDRVEELRPAAPEWRLLLQLSADDDLGTSFGEGFGRLFLWIRERDLQARAFEAARAILQ